jgi:Ca-activated chloride channel family protein
MSFGRPDYLWLLLAIPPGMVAFFWWSARTRRKLMGQFIQARLLPGLTAGVSTTREKIRAGGLILAVVCLILALAQPQWGYDLEEITQRGLDIVVAVDTSKSMLAEDIAPNRLARAKLAVLDLMQHAGTDRLGLVAFAGSAFLQCPLTVDDTAFRESVDALSVNTIPEGGTAIADAIETARLAFKEGDNYKVIVLFTDGEDHDSGAVEAAGRAKEAGVILFTIGIGSADGELLRIRDANGQPDFIRDEHGNVVKSRLNQALLQEIAGPPKLGFYLPLQGANTIDVLYQRGIAPLPKSESREMWVRHVRERYHWPLAVALVLLVAEIFFPERKRELKPAGLTAATLQPAPAGAALLILVLLLSPMIAQGSPGSALREYQAGQYDKALKDYEHLIQTHGDDLRLQFNAGAAAYRATNFDTAIQHFTATLTAGDLKLQEAAYFNLGNTHYQRGLAAKDLDELQEAWETAVKSYENALALDKTDPDARHNLEYVKAGIGFIAQMREAARKAKEAADEATRRRNYHLALEIMQQQMQKNIAAKPFQDYVKRLKDIDAIATPHP